MHSIKAKPSCSYDSCAALLCVADIHASKRSIVMVQGRTSMAQLVNANQSLQALMSHVMHTARWS